MKGSFPARVLISVPTKNFPHASDRNKIKRLAREVYRQNKHLLYAALVESPNQLLIAILFLGKKIESFQTIRICLQNAVKHLADVVAEKNSR